VFQIEKIGAIVDATLQTKPAGMTHWSCRTMAQSQGVSKSTVNNIWRAHNLQPHRTETFKLSRDPKFLEKMTDVVGLYVNPPQQAIILCVDEKSQIQALDRTQPGLPIKKGRCGTMTHDYKRNGTTTLFAALDTLQGKVVGECHERHRHQEFLKFLRRLNTEFPGDVPLHLVMDNYEDSGLTIRIQPYRQVVVGNLKPALLILLSAVGLLLLIACAYRAPCHQTATSGVCTCSGVHT
jgi:hypothetical protein